MPLVVTCHDAHPAPEAVTVNVACGTRDRSRVAAETESVAGPTEADTTGAAEDGGEDEEGSEAGT